MAKRKNAAGLTKDDRFYGAPSLKTFEERLEIAKQAQLEAIAKSKTTDLSPEELKKWKEKSLPFLIDWSNDEERRKLFVQLRLGEPSIDKLGKFGQAFEKAQNDVQVAYQSKRKKEWDEAEARKDEKKQSGKKAQKAKKAEEKTEAKARKAQERAEAKARKAEEKARKAAEKAEQKAAKKRKGLASWIYWKIREQRAKARESANHLEAGKLALKIARRIREAQQRLKDFLAPMLDAAAKLKTPEARLVWSKEPWTHQERNRYNWGKRQDVLEAIQNHPEDETQDPEKARADAKRKTLLREIDHAKAIERSIDYVMAELAEDETNLLRSSLERSYEKVRADIAKELEDERRAIDADKADEDRIADLKDYTRGGQPRRTAPETRIPQNAPRLGSYGESVIFGQPSPDQIKAAVNLEYEGKDFSKRIWGDTEKLARELKDIMQSAIINGEGAEETARKLSQRMGVHFSHCLRLVRTEHNRIMNQAQLDQMRDAEVKYYIFKAIHDSRTCGHCTRLDGKRVKIDDVKTGVNCPPIHPSCRCTIIPDFGNGGGDGGDGNGGPDTSWISDLFRKHLGTDAADAAREAQAETGTASASSAQTAPEKAPQASNATVATASSTPIQTVATASSADARPPKPKGKDRKKKAEGAGVQRTIEQYLKELEAREAKDSKQAQAIEKAAEKARNFPTAENIEAVAELQDAAMLAEEQAQQAAIGAQRKAIEAEKPAKEKKASGEISKPNARGNRWTVATRSANRDTEKRKANPITTTQEKDMHETAQEIKKAEKSPKPIKRKATTASKLKEERGSVQIKTADEDEARAYARWLKAKQPQISQEEKLKKHHKLSEKQKELLSKISKPGDYLICRKKDVKIKDIAYYTAITGNEFAIFTRGNERLIIRGTHTRTRIDQIWNKLKTEGWKFSAHTHPGLSENSLRPSTDDGIVLQELGQEQSVTLNPAGEHKRFNKAGMEI